MQRRINTISAFLEGSRTCTAEGLRVFAASPVLKMCRALIAAGKDPDCKMEVFRRGKLCFIVPSIGEGAVLRVTERRDGRPIFATLSDAAASKSDLTPVEVSTLQKASRAA